MSADDLPARVAAWLRIHCNHAPPLRLGVAVSAGADSVVLLHLLHALLDDSVTYITVIHVDHQLRGFESQNDRQFVEELAAALGLSCQVHAGPPPPGNLEAQARWVRMEIFRRVRRDLDLHYIALGHTASDQAETVLFRLLRGSGLTGLAGMKPVSRGLIRPLLTTTRQEVRNFALAHHLSWREDSSNSDLRFRRNRLRLQVIPDLVAHFNPRLEETLTATAALARAEEDYWSPEVARALESAACPAAPLPGLILRCPALAHFPLALRRRVLRSAVGQVRGDLHSIEISHIEDLHRICASAFGHDRVQLPGIDAIRSFDMLLLTTPIALHTPRDYYVSVSPGTTVELPFAAGTLALNPVAPDSSICVTVKGERIYFAEEAELDGEAVLAASHDRKLQVRNWQPGDRILLAGADRPEKLKTLFQEYRVPLWERRHWPVLIAGNDIVWARRFGVAAQFAAPATGRQRLQIAYWPVTLAGEMGSESKDSRDTSFNI